MTRQLILLTALATIACSGFAFAGGATKGDTATGLRTMTDTEMDAVTAAGTLTVFDCHHGCPFIPQIIVQKEIGADKNITIQTGND